MPDLTSSKLKIFAAWKTCRGWKDKLWCGRKYLQTAYLTEDYLLSGIYKELSKLIDEKTNKPIKNWPKTLADTSLMSIYTWQINTWKKSSTWCVIGELQIKATVKYHHTPNVQKPEHWQQQMLVSMWSNMNSQILLEGMKSGTATLEDSLVVSY